MRTRSEITAALERIYPDYTVDSFDIKRHDNGDGIYVLRDIKLTGRHMLSEDGMIDGQPLPMIVAPTAMYGELAGFVIKFPTREEETSFDI